MLRILARQADLLALFAALAGLAWLTSQHIEERERLLAGGQRAPFCASDEVPSFQLGFAALADLLGETMGQPLECEHPDLATGDVLQQTTAGLASYRWCTNTLTFAAGSDYWALTPDGTLRWSGPNPDPPIPLPTAQSSTLRRPCPTGP